MISLYRETLRQAAAICMMGEDSMSGIRRIEEKIEDLALKVATGLLTLDEAKRLVRM